MDWKKYFLDLRARFSALPARFSGLLARVSRLPEKLRGAFARFTRKKDAAVADAETEAEREDSPDEAGIPPFGYDSELGAEMPGTGVLSTADIPYVGYDDALDAGDTLDEGYGLTSGAERKKSRTIKKIDIVAVLFFFFLVAFVWGGIAIFASSPGMQFFFSACFTLSVAAIPLVYGRVRRIPFSLFMCPGLISKKLLLGSLVVMTGALLASTILAGFSSFFLEELGVSCSDPVLPGALLLSLFLAALLPAVCEEILFRGFVLRGLICNVPGNSRRAVILPVFLCAFLFAFFHFDPYSFLSVFCCGLALSYVAYVTGSLVLPMVMHFFNNAVSLCLFWLAGGNSAADDASLAEAAQGGAALAEALGILLLCLLGIFAAYICVFLGLQILKNEMRRLKSDGHAQDESHAGDDADDADANSNDEESPDAYFFSDSYEP